MGGFSAGDILFILLVGSIVGGLLVVVGMVRKTPDAPPAEDAPDDEARDG